MAIEFKDGKYVDESGRVTLDPTVYKDWQIAEEAEKALPPVEYFREKLGLLPDEIIPYGNRQMCATDFGAAWENLSIETEDTAVLAFGEPSLWRFDAEKPRLKNGVWFNLYNNMWNTNFPMWYDEDALFRFRIRVGREM